MVQPHSVSSDVEVSGRVVQQAVVGLREHSDEAREQGHEILARHGFLGSDSDSDPEPNSIPDLNADPEPNLDRDPDPDAWYSLRDLLRALDDIGETLGKEALTRLGRSVPEGVEWPPNVDSASKGFATVNDAYQLNHRGGEFGYYEFVETDEREQRVVCANPYPCAFDEGIIEGTLRAFGRDFSYTPMVLVHETSDHCRAEGGDRCEYRVVW